MIVEGGNQFFVQPRLAIQCSEKLRGIARRQLDHALLLDNALRLSKRGLHDELIHRRPNHAGRRLQCLLDSSGHPSGNAASIKCCGGHKALLRGEVRRLSGTFFPILRVMRLSNRERALDNRYTRLYLLGAILSPKALDATTQAAFSDLE